MHPSPSSTRGHRRHCLPILTLTCGAALGIEAQAQVAAPESADASTITYGQEFFAQHNVTTAEEILRRIPGVTAILDGGSEEQERRGFGSDGDQVLINGRRLAGKSNEISSALRRIQIQNLDRVELLRGTSNDIDVRSDGVVVNVILREGDATTSSGSVKAAAQFNEYGKFELDGAVNYNGELGKLSYFLSLEKNSVTDGERQAYTRRTRDERYFFPDGEIMQLRDLETDRDMTEYTFAANSTYEFERGDRLQLNILVKPSTADEDDVIDVTEFAVDGSQTGAETDLRSSRTDPALEWEFGSTYERRVGDASNLKILTLYNYTDTTTVESRNQLIGNQFNEISRNPADVVATEAILRGSYFWPLTDAQTLEVGGEFARNTLEQTIALFFDRDGDGIAEEIDIFNPTSEVEETRTEVFVNHNWTLTDRWTASSSLVAESSEISQSGSDIENSANFDFIKPRIDVRFAPNPADQYRFKIERTVSQLDFADFVPRYEIRQDRFDAGNPFLEPETAWEYEAGFEHRLPDDQGVIEARVFYNDIQDRIESVAIDLDGDGAFDPATGNIGDATEYGGEVSFSLRMARLGVPDLILDGSYLRRKSRVTDPFTGRERKMATMEDYLVEFGIRHDMSDLGLSYGFNYSHNGGTNVRSEWQEYRSFSRDPKLTAFVEKRFGARWILRFDALSLTPNKRERDRILFEDDAATGTVRRLEHFDESRDRRFTVSLTATF